MSHVWLFVEGGHKSSRSDCHSAFTSLFKKAGISGKQFQVVAKGGRDEVWAAFLLAISERQYGLYFAMLIDSDKSVSDLRNPWNDFLRRKPERARDDQLLFMVTCMDAWIMADRTTLKAYYGIDFDMSQIPAARELETLPTATLKGKLKDATSNCLHSYKEGTRSFLLLSKVDPQKLKVLKSFEHAIEILDSRLRGNDTPETR